MAVAAQVAGGAAANKLGTVRNLERDRVIAQHGLAVKVSGRPGNGREGGRNGMWQESEAAIGDLLSSDLLGRLGAIDDPTTVHSWWKKNGYRISADTMNRDFLFGLAQTTRSAIRPDWVSLLWHIFAWGVMGDFRNVGSVIQAARGSERDELNQLLGDAADASHRGEIRKGYEVVYRKIPRLGPAFFTKFLYFTGDRDSTTPRCLILDSRVKSALFTLTGLDFYSDGPGTYEDYCLRVAGWSRQHGAPPDEVEFRLYQFGQRISSTRWRWLHAEVSLYREGNSNVGFDDILNRCLGGEN